VEHAGLTRLRWRLRGALQWPVFALLIVVDAVLLSVLPISGDGPDAFAAVVLALFFNLVAVAALGPVLGWLWRRRRPDLPKVVARDSGGTVALLVMTGVLVVIGVVHHSVRADAHQRLVDQALAAVRYIGHQTDPSYRQYERHLDEIDTIPFGGGLYRTCIPGDDPARPLCLFVRADLSPPDIREDPSRAPNQTYVQYSDR
jgi:hypothetical protein